MPSSITSAVLQGGVVYVAGLVLWKLVLKKWFVRSPLDVVPGPLAKSWMTGHLGPFFDRSWSFHEELVNEYPGVVKLQGLFGNPLLFVHDPLALHHIVVKDQYIYEETPIFLLFNKYFFGDGLLASVGERHRHQRKMLNPVFHINHMRHMIPIFYSITHKLKTAIHNQLTSAPDGSNTQDIDMLNWMTRAALEMVGQGGLGHSFDTLEKDELNPFVEAIKSLVPTLGPMFLLFRLLPYLEKLGSPSFRRRLLLAFPWPRLQKCREIADLLTQNSHEILNEKREALMKGDDEASKLVEQVGEGKDIMSVLLRANMAASEEDRLPDSELLGHISTLLFAAMETTSGALAHILHLLALHPAAQSRLRAELLEATSHNGGQDLGYDELMNLPYLEAVCRETLRLHAPAPSLNRKTTKDVILPLSTPIPSSSSSSEPLQAIHIPKNTDIIVGILASNVNPALWGEDAHLWKPERWLGVDGDKSEGSPLKVDGESSVKIPGIYSNLMTFMGGGRACIGFKFSQLEMKVVLSVLISHFNFSLVPGTSVVWNFAGVQFPSTGPTAEDAKKSERSELPLRVSLVKPSGSY